MYFTLLQISCEKYSFLVEFLSFDYCNDDGGSSVSALAFGFKVKPSLGCYLEIFGVILVYFNMDEHFK